jgi:outer membrane protein OmpA-like peptidoglycan-associated protein
VVATAVFLLGSVLAFGQEKEKVKGFITSRAGDTVIVKSKDGNATTVILTDDTKTIDKKGLFGLDKEVLSNTVLIPGLKVSVEGTVDEQGRVTAKKIVTDGDDLEAAQMIQAGLHPTAEQVATNVNGIAANKAQLAAQGKDIQANQQATAANTQQIQENMKDIEEHTARFKALSEYEVKSELYVKFAVGSTKISAADQQQLKQLAETAKSLNGYMVEVIGYADSTGSAAVNTKLSKDRAHEVVTFLMQQGGVPVRRILAPGAMGEYGATASNETKEGRADNRRVEVKVIVNKGLAGS